MKMTQLALAIGMMGVTGMGYVYADDQAKSEEKIEVTGSSIKTSVSKAGALPVQTLKREDIDKLGVTNTEQLLATISATQTAGSINSTQGEGQSTWGLSSVSLRALGSKRTLVLINGRRVANYATDGTSVDLNSVPLSAVERVEVLKDGASSTYGSDAVAGVVNFILRKNYQGLETSGYVGTPTRGGGGSIEKGGLVAGFGDFNKNRYNAIFSLDYEHDQQLLAKARSFANKGEDIVGGVFDNSATPSGRIQPWYLPGQPIGSSGAVAGPIGAPGGSLGNVDDANCTANGSYFSPDNGTCRYNAAGDTGLIPEINRLNLSANGHFNLSDNVELYAEGIYTHTDTTVVQQPSPISPSFLAPDPAFAATSTQQSILLMPGGQFYPTAWLNSSGNSQYIGQPLAVSYRVFEGGGRDHKDKSDLYRILAGVKGTFGTWDYDLAVSQSASTVEEDTTGGYELQTKLVQVLNACQCYNPASLQQTAQEQAAVQSSLYNGLMVKSKLTYTGIDGKVSGPIVDLPAGPLAGAVGFSARKVDDNFTSSAAAQSGDVSGYGGNYLPYDKSRTESSVFAEFDAPLLDNLEADVSVRGDHFANIGNTTNPKVSLRFQPFKQLLLRASYGTGFRAPSLPELYTPQSFANTNTFSDPFFASKTLPNGQPNPNYTTGSAAAKEQWNETVGGNPNLKPEKSKQSSIGFVLQPVRDFALGADFYHIRVDNAIVVPSPSQVLAQNFAGNPAYTSSVTRAAGTNAITNIQATNVNAGGIDTEGVDVDVNWRHKLDGIGTLSASLTGTYISKYDLTRVDGNVEQSVAATVTQFLPGTNKPDYNNDVLTALSNGGIILRWRHTATIGLSNASWSGNLTWNYQSGYQDSYMSGFNGPGTTPLSVASFSTYDAQIGYTGFKNLKLSLGAKNLLDKDPPLVVGTGIYFQSAYDPTYYDARGRFVYLSGSYKFW